MRSIVKTYVCGELEKQLV